VPVFLSGNSVTDLSSEIFVGGQKSLIDFFHFSPVLTLQIVKPKILHWHLAPPNWFD
jgi:hypothetical protein